MNSSSVRDVLLDHCAWAKLSQVDVEAISGELAALVGPEFSYVQSRRYTTGYVIPTFRHVGSGIEFNLLPGGTFCMGLSHQEYEAAMRLPNCREDLLAGLTQTK